MQLVLLGQLPVLLHQFLAHQHFKFLSIFFLLFHLTHFLSLPHAFCHKFSCFVHEHPFLECELGLAFWLQLQSHIVKVVNSFTIALHHHVFSFFLRSARENVIFCIQENIHVWKNILFIHQSCDSLSASFRQFTTVYLGQVLVT